MIVLSDHLPIVALVSRYPTNELIGRRPLPKRIAALTGSIERTTTCGISHPFGQLSPTSGQVTYALLSRPPLTIRASPDRPFDLHVSCTPPALILSQDQTLRNLRSLAAATLSEGLTTRTSLSRISCHSSVVKVQRPGHDGPRRRPTMMGLCARGVKPGDPSGTGTPDPVADPGRRRHGGEW